MHERRCMRAHSLHDARTTRVPVQHVLFIVHLFYGEMADGHEEGAAAAAIAGAYTYLCDAGGYTLPAVVSSMLSSAPERFRSNR